MEKDRKRYTERQVGLAGEPVLLKTLKDRKAGDSGKASYVVFYCTILWGVPLELYNTETLEIRGMAFYACFFQSHPPTVLVEMQIGTATTENRMVVP